MLRASSRRTGRPAALAALIDPSKDSRLPAGSELLAFADAAVLRNRETMTSARQALLDTAGPAAVIRAAGCAGNFEMMNRLVDAVGIPVRRQGMALAEELGLEFPEHLRPR